MRNESQVVRISDWEAVEHFYEMGNTMDDLTNPALLLHATHKSPVLVIIEHHMLARTCMLNLFRRELTGVEIVELATSSDLDCVSERDVRLVALNIGDKPIVDPSIEDELTLLERSCPNASIALLSSRDDEATASAAMQRGVRGFFRNAGLHYHRDRACGAAYGCRGGAWLRLLGRELAQIPVAI